MKAAVIHDYSRPLEIEEVPTHTDIHAARGDMGYSMNGGFAEYAVG
jgi:hypothetical protein